jgi:rod shape determining protein RodA
MDSTRSIWHRIHIDPWLSLAILVLLTMGLVVLYSASGQDQAMVTRQAIRMGLGLVIMVAVAQVRPEILSRVSVWLFAIGLLLLVALNFFGTGRGAHRWLDLGFLRFQPSEIMKLAVPMICARFFAAAPLPPGILQILFGEQPDLGTAALVLAAGGSVVFIAGLRWRYIIWSCILFLVSLVPMWTMMHDYQRQRILTLLDPEQDPLGAGYHIIQSVIAVGSGGLFGKGWLHGTQSQLEFLPERHTDFIFAVLCEEFGLVGALALLSVYLFVILRGLQIAAQAQENFGRLLAGSLAMTLFIYVFVNMGMVIGQLPVVGVPLPLISYGGTSLVTLMASFGILMSVHTHRKMLSF